MKTCIWLLLMYLAAVSHLISEGSPLAVDFSAVAVVCGVRWFSPGKAACLAFLTGLLLDGLGTGPLGLQAAILVALAGLLPRLGFAAAPQSAARWMWAVFLTAWLGDMISTAVELLPAHRWQAWEQLLVPQFWVAGVTALMAGAIVGSWRQLTGTPCTTH